METETATAPATASTERPVDVVETVEFGRPALYPKQEDAIFDRRRYSWIEAGTKSGKTAGCIVWLAEKAAKGRPGAQFWWVAPIFGQAKIAFRRLKQSLSPGCFVANETELTIRLLAPDTTICFKGADKPDSLYGEDVYAAVIDEASRVKVDSWFAVRSTLTATGGDIRIIGNVKGRKNWFYKGSRRAASGEVGHSFHKITCHDAVAAGILDPAEITDAQAVLPPHVFKQLYEAEAADDEGNPFGIAAIAACTVEKLSELPPVLWAWDFAKSHDFTVGIGLDSKGDVCRIERFQKPWNDTKTLVKEKTAGKPAMGDSTGVGDAIVEDLQIMGVAIEGYVFTPRSKQQLMEGLAADLQQGKTHVPKGVLVDELESFEYAYHAHGVRYEAPEGFFDDCVCSLAMARLMYRRGGYGSPFAFSSIRGDAESGERRTEARDIWRSNRSSQLVD